VLEPALPYIVSGWLVGVFALSVWHLGGWAQLQRLRRKMVKQVDDKLHSKLKELAKRLRVKQTIQLMESALVQIPTVVGWLRPVILLPASALTGLSAEQLEAILAHELAHIKRCDYLINILQTVVEILGFYHPAVWWVSHKIRAERENCCDDLAVSISGDRVCYARALTSMEEIRTGQGQLAVAAAGGNLFRRIRRVVGKDSAEKTSFSWIPAITAILLIAGLLIPTVPTLTARAQTETATAVTEPDESVEPNEPIEIMNLKNVEMITIIEKLSEWTGKVIIPTEDLLKQKITIHAPEKLPRSKAIAVIYSALRLKGYIAEQTDEAIFLKPEAKPGKVPTISDDEPFTMLKNKDQVVSKIFKLKNHRPSQMAQIVRPLLSEIGQVSADERTGNLLMTDTVENLMRIEKIISEFDEPKAEQSVAELFEIRYGDPAEIVKLLRMLITGQTDPGSLTSVMIGPNQQPIVLIPEPRRKWIIAQAY